MRKPDRHGHDDGDQGHHDGAVDEGQDAEALGGEEGGPAGSGEEVDDGDFAEELDGFAEEGDDDAGGGEDGNEGAEEEDGVDAALDELAAEGVAAGAGRSRSPTRFGSSRFSRGLGARQRLGVIHSVLRDERRGGP